jgi:RNA recognition motif-containing protein
MVILNASFLLKATSLFLSIAVSLMLLIYLLPIFTKRSSSMRMYVGNLMYNMTEEELRDLFIPFGEVLTSHIVTDQYTRQSKNMGYVEMAVSAEGRKAVKELNGKEINNRFLIVRKHEGS